MPRGSHRGTNNAPIGVSPEAPSNAPAPVAPNPSIPATFVPVVNCWYPVGNHQQQGTLQGEVIDYWWDPNDLDANGMPNDYWIAYSADSSTLIWIDPNGDEQTSPPS